MFVLDTPESKAYDEEYRPATDPATAHHCELEGWFKPLGEDTIIANVLWMTQAGVEIAKESVTIDGSYYSALILAPVPAPAVADDVALVTATSGTTTTVTKTAAGWTADALIGKVLTVRVGTNSGIPRIVLDNTTDTITFAAMPVACDNTTQFEVNAILTDLFRKAVLAMAMTIAGYEGENL